MYEYRAFALLIRDDLIDGKLNEYAGLGWRLFAAVPYPVISSGAPGQTFSQREVLFIFEREKK